MPKPRTVDLTRRESQIMAILYRRRRATVEDIRAELPDAPGPSSVRKLLEIMIERGLLAREYDGPRFVLLPRRPSRRCQPIGAGATRPHLLRQLAGLGRRRPARILLVAVRRRIQATERPAEARARAGR